MGFKACKCGMQDGSKERRPTDSSSRNGSRKPPANGLKARCLQACNAASEQRRPVVAKIFTVDVVPGRGGFLLRVKVPGLMFSMEPGQAAFMERSQADAARFNVETALNNGMPAATLTAETDAVTTVSFSATSDRGTLDFIATGPRRIGRTARTFFRVTETKPRRRHAAPPTHAQPLQPPDASARQAAAMQQPVQ